MNYIEINKGTVTDGTGVRVSLYVSGCRNHCPGCHNQNSWSFEAGQKYLPETTDYILNLLSPSYIAGLTLCGGEPMEPENQRALLDLCYHVKAFYPTKNIWCYTGYELEDLLPGGRKHAEVTDELLSYIDVMVVGPYKRELRDISKMNPFRGSTNQRIIRVQDSLIYKKPIYLEGFVNNN